MTSKKKNIVIVGGGFAGVSIATQLEKELAKISNSSCRIIIIEKKTHFYHSIAGVRSAVIDWDDKIMIPYTNLFQNSENRVIQASAKELEKDYIVLDREVPEFGTQVTFDYLVLATGMASSAPQKAAGENFDESRKSLEQLRQKIKQAEAILIVGGGPVGVELAGEIRQNYKDKKVTLIHSQDRLFSTASNNAKLSQWGHDLLQKNKVDLILNDRLEVPHKGNIYHPENSFVRTKNGQTLTADLVFFATGSQPQTDWLKNTSLGADILAENGYIKVKSTYQVDHPQLSHVFVLGDVANFDETKHAYRIKSHSVAVLNNLIQLAVYNNKKLKNEYKKAPDAMFVTFGEKQGVGVLPFFGGIVVGSMMVGFFKSGSLFYQQSWKSLNAKPPVA